VDRLASDIRERTAKIQKDIEEIRSQGRVDGEEARRALAARADEEAERIRKDSAEEIERRIAAARVELRQAAADLTAGAATEILSREITPADRERLLADSVSRLRDAPR
jgi:F0F1-type ATP synthase membrane subunit b/b'